MSTQVAPGADTALVQGVMREVGKVVVGQDYMIERLLIGLLTGGHVLLEGVPGLAKTLTVRTLAETIDADVLSASSSRPTCCRPTSSARMIYNQRTRRVHASSRGRSSPTSSSPTRSTARRPRCSRRCSRRCRSSRSRSATRRITLPEPFLVLATQNPIEQEGTYPLPEAQVDRFMLKLHGRLPDARRRAGDHAPHGERRCRSRSSTSRRRRRSSRRARPHRRAVHRRADRRLHRRHRARDARAGGVGLDGARAADRVRRLPARVDLRSRRRRARTRSCAAAATSRPRTSRRSRPTCCATA